MKHVQLLNGRCFRPEPYWGGRDGVTGESLADMLFKNVFENKIITGTTKLFDTMAGSKALSIPKFTEYLGDGFHYAEIISHGLVDNYVNHHGTSFFNTTQASDFVNKGHTLITTMACFTNSFDIEETNENPNPCMSEAFFRNPRSGVIGYLGSSREGWYNSSLDYSMAYENEFYQRLLYPELQPKNKNFGSLVSYTKRSINPLADSEFVYRWLHLCINALGDPETPVFSKTPRNFTAENVSAHYNSEGVLEINTGSKETRVCVSSSRNNNYYEVDFGATTYFDTGFGNFDVWVTQQDYIPFHISVSKLRPLDVDSNIDNSNSPEILSVIADSNTGNATIRCKFSKPEPPTISLYITSVDNGMTYLYTLKERNSEQLNINIDGLKRGFYILELNEGGIWSNPFRFVVK